MERAFYFDTAYLARVLQNTNYTKITFEFQSDAAGTGNPGAIHRYTYNAGKGSFIDSYNPASDNTNYWYNWGGDLSTGISASWCLRGDGAGLYIRNITLQ